MKPSWLICKKCLFCKSKETEYNDYMGNEGVVWEGFCQNKDKKTTEKDWCNKWVCANCLKDYNEWGYDSESEKIIYIDHNKCEEAKFE